MFKEIYISRARRDARFAELKASGRTFIRRVSKNQQLHPEYIVDARDEGIQYTTGFGNTDYRRMWGTLYLIEGV